VNKTLSNKKSLIKALQPYKCWDSWIMSPAEPFTKQELLLIEIYRKTGSYVACAEQLHIPLTKVPNRVTSLIFRLRFQLKDYKHWQAGQRSLFDLLKDFGVESLNDLKVITVNDLKFLNGEPFKLTYRQLSNQKPP
jgi:hypothetical protein